MSKTLYLECASGISGDMSVGALIDLGADRAVLEKVISSLPTEEFNTEITRVNKSGLMCTDFNVILANGDNHDHDMEYLHGHMHEHEYHHDHEEHHHDHDHHDEEHHHEHHHVHRTLKEVYEIIDKADMTDRARDLAEHIFMIIAAAEGKAHGMDPYEVHFHEVGAMDSIVDIVAFATCYDNLGITDTVVEGLTEGGGTVRCAHGILPVPVPAVCNIAEENGLTLRKSGIQGELVTPTGAAIAAAVKTADKLPKAYKIIKTGLGAGKRNYELPSILRAMLIEPVENGVDEIYRLETDIDDCPSEALGYVMGALYEAGAREVHFSPIYMKKNRPGIELVVICDADKIEIMEKIIFAETTTIGIRKLSMERSVATRKITEVTTAYGTARVKFCKKADRNYAYPEYEDVAKLARENDIPFLDMYEKIKGEACNYEN